MPLSTGQVTISTSAQALRTPPLEAEGLLLKARSSNSGVVYLGTSTVTTSTGYALEPGESLEISKQLSPAGSALFNIPFSSIYVIGTTGDKLTWLAST